VYPVVCLLALGVLFSPVAGAQSDKVLTFGTTVVIPSGLHGVVYRVRRNTAHLPNFRKTKPAGSIYTTALNVPSQDFKTGFPGVTKRFEWFAIDYTGRFWIEKPGDYRFVLTSDDGSKLYIDEEEVIDNDGLHPPLAKETTIPLSGGIHRIRVSYFQGPRFHVALLLQVEGPGDQLKVFSTDEFKPPPNPETWTFPATTGSGKEQPTRK
jgi:hypothetical protein